MLLKNYIILYLGLLFRFLIKRIETIKNWKPWMFVDILYINMNRASYLYKVLSKNILGFQFLIVSIIEIL